ncbi:MAG: hypothetical protein AAF492_33090, partial [Verrucomicrobiota bacterium]
MNFIHRCCRGLPLVMVVAATGCMVSTPEGGPGLDGSALQRIASLEARVAALEKQNTMVSPRLPQQPERLTVAHQDVFKTPGDTSWTCPAGVTKVTIKALAAGGGGGGG